MLGILKCAPCGGYLFFLPNPDVLCFADRWESLESLTFYQILIREFTIKGFTRRLKRRKLRRVDRWYTLTLLIEYFISVMALGCGT